MRLFLQPFCQSMLGSLRTFRSSTRGSISVIMGFALVTLTTALGMAVDAARFFTFKTEMQQLSDLASIAAASDPSNGTQASLAAVAGSYLTANAIPSSVGTVTLDAAVYDSATKSFELRLNGTMNTTFLKMAGVENMSASVTSKVLRALPGPVEMALTLDLTTSMSFNFIPGKTKLQALKEASAVLINELMAYSDVRMAIVPFGQHVMVPTSNSGSSWLNSATWRTWDTWKGFVGVRSDPHRPVISSPTSPAYPYIYPASCAAPIVPLTNDKTLLLNSVGSAFTQVATYIPSGLLWAWNVLSSEAPYTEGRTKAEVQAVRGRKVVVLMAEGDNNVAPRASGDTSTATASELSTITNPLMLETCTNMKADGVQIYVVAILGTTAAGQALLQSCASSASHFYYAANPQALTDAFRDISSKMVSVRLTN